MLVGHSKVAFPLWSWHPDAELREERIKSSIGNCGWDLVLFSNDRKASGVTLW